MSDETATFVEDCLAGRALPAEIDDHVERWHESDSSLGLHEFLGMTQEEYAWWVERPETLPAILDARRAGVPPGKSVRRPVPAE